MPVLPARKWRAPLDWLLSERALPKLARLMTIIGLGWLIVEGADRFGVAFLPASGQGLVMFFMGVAIAWLASQQVIATRSRPAKGAPPAEVFATALIQYARDLAADGHRRDRAILDLRRTSSRRLHLMGAAKHRVELGRIALRAASAVKDRQIQASILLDDLGWSLHKAGDTRTALANIEEALSIVDDELAAAGELDALVDLKVKALRHRANIHASSIPLDSARRAFAEPRQLALKLSRPASAIHVAQLDHSEAEAILNHLEAKLGQDCQIDPGGPNGRLLAEAVALSERAERVFADLGDTEREAKVLSLKVRLLTHDIRKQKHREAAARLDRLATEVARTLY